MATKAQARATAKYDATNTKQVILKLNLKTDKEWQKRGSFTSEEAKELHILNFRLSRTYG